MDDEPIELHLKEPRNDKDCDELWELAQKYEQGKSVPQDYDIARQIYEKCGSYGHAKSLNSLGWLYQNGLGVKKNINKAEEFFFMAAIGNSVEAMINLGNIYEFNEKNFDKVDWKTARIWYQRAALCGSEVGMFNYANCLHYGYGGPKDMGTAFFIFQRIAGKVKGVYFYLGLYYENGFVVHKDMKMATDMYLKGAKDEEDGYCCTQLGNICVDGRGIGMDEPDYEAAAKYYIAAICNDDPLSYANIAHMYERGFVNGKKDKETAIKWYQLGAILGEEHCAAKLKKLGVNIVENPNYDFPSLAKELYAHIDTSGESL